jgi:uncharacterized protein YkwD
MNGSRHILAAVLSTLIWASAQTAAAAARGTAPAGAIAHQAEAGTCTGTEETPDASNLESIRAATFCLINRERIAHGESALKLNTHLQTSAQAHSDNMVADDYFEHVGPSGDTPVSRMRAAGYLSNPRNGYIVGENIAYGTLWLSTPQSIVTAWMNSPGHRANILNPHFRETGIGVSPSVPASFAKGQEGGIYTQDFGVIITP